MLLSLSACSSPPPTAVTQTPSAPSVTTAITPSPTNTLSPSPTPQPRAVLLAPDSADPEQQAAIQDLLKGLSSQANLSFQVAQSLSPAELSPDLRVVVGLPPDPGLQALAAAAPKTQFLAVGIPGLQPAANLVQVDGPGASPDQQGFLAGYIASLVTPDWRVGVISTNDTPAGNANRSGFLNGAIYYCGLCRPAQPPFVQYPVAVDLPSGASQAEQQAAAEALIAQAVTTVYVAPGAGDAGLLESLAQAGVNIIGTETPPATIEQHWIATITKDPLAGLRLAWSQVMGGLSSGESNTTDQNPPLAIENVNDALLSTGRQRLVEQVRDDLADGFIDTGVDLQTGEAR